MKPFIKAGNIANLTDARYFAAYEVRWVGFPLDPALPGGVSEPAFHALRDWVEGPESVGEFELMPAREIRLLAARLKINTVQVSPFYGRGDLEKLAGLTVIREVVAEPEMQGGELFWELKKLEGAASLFFMNFQKTGVAWPFLKNNRPFLQTVKAICQDFPVLLGLDFLPAELPDMLATLSPRGLNLVGGQEEKVGVKSFDVLNEIFEALETVD